MAVVAGLGRANAGEQPGRPGHPNILFIFIDDMGYADPSCFGNPKIKTPNIDRLAHEGIRFTNFYTNSPICSPSRVAVMTGQYPARWDIHSYLNSRERNRERGMANFLDPAAPATARLLKQAGYATAHFGKWHIGGGRDVDDAPLPQVYGFDESLVSFEGLGDRILFPNDKLCDQSAKLGHGVITRVPKHRSTETCVDRTIDFMRRNPEKPFYIELFPNDVHDAHLPKPGAAEKFDGLTDNPFERSFFAVLEELDRQLGRVLAAVDGLGQAGNTLIVFASDNGPTDWPHYYKKGYEPPGFTGPFHGRKWSLYEGGIRMPFIARWKGVIPAGITNDETVMCGIDLSPTFCRFAGAETDPVHPPDGEVMADALLGKKIERKHPIFWQYGTPFAQLMPGNPDFVSPSLAVRDGKWKLLVNPDGSDAQLYNLADDIGETKNRFQDFPEKAAGLWQKIRTWAAHMDIPVEDTPLAQPGSPPEQQ